MSKHWFIAHLIKKFSDKKKLGLDIGIGNDNWKEFKKCKFVGIDRKKESSCEIQLDLEKELPFVDKTFDIIIAINSLNYVKNSRQLLKEVNRVLKDDAVLLCVVDNENSKNFPAVWEQKYLDRILKVSGFKSIISSSLSDYFYAKWYNKTSVYGFAVVKKIYDLSEKEGEKIKKTVQPVNYAKSYNIKTTHPEN